ncbi:efflux transporter outer membrane subunit [Duganella sp. S19_KUP01_CR8]|uniref:efflux transporter outer membrane subunit n=1 Tax=Duganella sp. S19_KUP01_CR8 TaxID=3025502 RepID=UPI002FCDAA99
MKRRIQHSVPLLAAMLLSACAAPQLSAPVLDLPAGFKEAQTPERAADGSRWQPARPAEARARGLWWLAFNDTVLNGLIDDASAANANLAVAAARVRQARALAGVAEADRGVQLDAQLGAQRGRAANHALGLPPGAAVGVGNTWQGKLAASYEVDLFGRVAASVGAAQADAAASEANYRSVLLALQADVAQTYFRLRATDAELATLERTVRLREQSVQVNQRRFDLGELGEFDLARAKTELATARAEAIGLQRQRVGAEHALAVLLGKPAASFAFAVQPLEEGGAVPAIPAGLPSALLERRPDITAAQRAMVAANARIGLARSAVFPALALTGAGGGESDTLASLFKWDARSWVVGALMSMPLIDGGRNKANIARSEAALDESVASYRQSVLTAFAEVEDNLAGLRILAGQGEQLDAAVLSARRSADLAQKLYQAGRSSYLDLLDAQRNLASVERNAVQLRGNRYVSTVALIRSLGGGWTVQ